jgi:hypothetical protein
MSASPRRRARWPWALAIVVVVLAALVVGGEFVARALVAQQVRSQVITALKLPADQQLDVEVGGIVLPQLIAGRLDELHLSSKPLLEAGRARTDHRIRVPRRDRGPDPGR